MADLGERTPLDSWFGDIWVEEIIDKVFRFIEMIVIATLIGVAMRVVWVEASWWLANGLALAAGLYLGIPAARWVVSRIPSSKGPRLLSKLLMLGTSVTFALAAVAMTSGLQILLSATFQIDEPAARIDYQLWKARSGLSACNGGARGSGPPPARDIAACERRWRYEIGRLEAEKQALIR